MALFSHALGLSWGLGSTYPSSLSQTLGLEKLGDFVLDGPSLLGDENSRNPKSGLSWPLSCLPWWCHTCLLI